MDKYHHICTSTTFAYSHFLLLNNGFPHIKVLDNKKVMVVKVLRRVQVHFFNDSAAILVFLQQKWHGRLPFFALALILIYWYIETTIFFVASCLLFKWQVERRNFFYFSGNVTVACSGSPLKISVISSVREIIILIHIYPTLQLVHWSHS